MVDWERKEEGERSSEKVTFCKSSVATCVFMPGPHLLTLWNVSLKSSRALWLLKFLSGKNIPVAWLWRNYRSLCQARVVPMPESGWQTSTHAYQVLVVLCGNIFKQVLSFYWVAASPVFNVSKAWRSGVQMSLNHKMLSFPEIKGEYKAGL